MHPLLEAEKAAKAGPMTLHCVRSGVQKIDLQGRRLLLDADAYLLLPSDAAVTVEAGQAATSLRVSIERPPSWPRDPGGFLAALRPTSGPVGRRLAELGAAQHQDHACIVVPAAEVGPLWGDVVAEEIDLRRRMRRAGARRGAAREALFRRLLIAADHLRSHHAEPLALDAMAAVIGMSASHFQRVFARVFGESPHRFLNRKRLAVARRLMAEGTSAEDAARRAGFGSRATLYRQLRRQDTPLAVSR